MNLNDETYSKQEAMAGDGGGVLVQITVNWPFDIRKRNANISFARSLQKFWEIFLPENNSLQAHFQHYSFYLK